MSNKAQDKASGAQAGERSTDAAAVTSDAAASAEALHFGDLVTTDAGEFAIVTRVPLGDDDEEGTQLLILGKPVRHDLPVTRVS